LATARGKWLAVNAILAGQNQIHFVQKRQWTSAANPLDFPDFMKCETMNSVLTFVLGAFVVLGVIFALQTIFRTREIRSLQIQNANINANYMRLQALANDVNAYNQKTPSPELKHILDATR
jgi:hypothetical protein